MAKQITFEHEGRPYVLEFTRASVTRMERSGFNASEVADYPMSRLPELFAGAFLAHHPGVKREVVDEIFGLMADKEALLGRLSEMYNAPLEDLLSEPGDGAKNLEWAAGW